MKIDPAETNNWIMRICMKLYCALNEFEIRIGILWLLVFIYSIIVSAFPVLPVKSGGGVSKLVWNVEFEHGNGASIVEFCMVVCDWHERSECQSHTTMQNSTIDATFPCSNTILSRRKYKNRFQYCVNKYTHKFSYLEIDVRSARTLCLISIYFYRFNFSAVHDYHARILNCG